MVAYKHAYLHHTNKVRAAGRGSKTSTIAILIVIAAMAVHTNIARTLQGGFQIPGTAQDELRYLMHFMGHQTLTCAALCWPTSCA